MNAGNATSYYRNILEVFFKEKKKSQTPTNYLHVKRKQRSDVNLKNSKLIKYPPPSFQEKKNRRGC